MDSEARKECINEANLLQNLPKHSNIVEYLDSFLHVSIWPIDYCFYLFLLGFRFACYYSYNCRTLALPKAQLTCWPRCTRSPSPLYRLTSSIWCSSSPNPEISTEWSNLVSKMRRTWKKGASGTFSTRLPMLFELCTSVAWCTAILSRRTFSWRKKDTSSSEILGLDATLAPKPRKHSPLLAHHSTCLQRQCSTKDTISRVTSGVLVVSSTNWQHSARRSRRLGRTFGSLALRFVFLHSCSFSFPQLFRRLSSFSTSFLSTHHLLFVFPFVFVCFAQIKSGEYYPLPDGYSPLLHELVARMIQVNPDDRPDIHQVVEVRFNFLRVSIFEVCVCKGR